MKKSFRNITLSALVLLGAFAIEPNPSNWDSNKIKVFTLGDANS